MLSVLDMSGVACEFFRLHDVSGEVVTGDISMLSTISVFYVTVVIKYINLR